jgi:serine/threonine-protein kinase RsbW
MPDREDEAQAAFSSNLDAMPALLEWFEQRRPGSIDEMVWIQAQTALVEGFTNAVRHAHGPLDPPPEVGVSMAVEPGCLRLGIRDHGHPFDLEAAWGEQTVDADREAHWGLIILQKLQRDFGWTIRYQPLSEGGNLLLLEYPLD